jgi:hypothetical protein
VSAALAYDFGADCGIYNVGTKERERAGGGSAQPSPQPSSTQPATGDAVRRACSRHPWPMVSTGASDSVTWAGSWSTSPGGREFPGPRVACLDENLRRPEEGGRRCRPW